MLLWHVLAEIFLMLCNKLPPCCGGHNIAWLFCDIRILFISPTRLNTEVSVRKTFFLCLYNRNHLLMSGILTTNVELFWRPEAFTCWHKSFLDKMSYDIQNGMWNNCFLTWSVFFSWRYNFVSFGLLNKSPPFFSIHSHLTPILNLHLPNLLWHHPPS